MPIYEFQCDACGKSFEELFRSVSEKKRPVCAHCGSRQVHKQFSVFGVGGGSSGSGGGGGCGSCSGGSCSSCHR